MKKNKKIKLDKKYYFIIGIISFILLLVILFFIYVGDYYHASLDDISVFEDEDSMKREVLSDDTIVYSITSEMTTGIIFYPGGKVEYLAYEPLVQECARYGFLCAVVKMPFNLAVFDVNAADSVISEYPDIENWYIAGHSLGGAMAANYVSKSPSDFSGLILLGAYSTKDLSDTSLNVISIYGSEDKVLNMKKYNKYKSNLPNSFKEEVISGGCHSYFGVYGKQSGDGRCTISNDEQIIKTMDIISNYIN